MSTWHDKHAAGMGFGDRLADKVAQTMGSWRFIIGMTIVITLWVTVNGMALIFSWDLYPFILLNLLFSVQAAYAAPIIMMAQNRQAERDRVHAEVDYQNNQEAVEHLRWLRAKLDNKV